MLLKTCIVVDIILIAVPQQVSVKSFLYSLTDSKILYHSILKLK